MLAAPAPAAPQPQAQPHGRPWHQRLFEINRRHLRGLGIAAIADCIVVGIALTRETWWSVEALFLCGVVVSAFLGDWVGGLAAWIFSALLISNHVTRDLLIHNSNATVTPTAYVTLSLPLALLTSWFSVRSGRTNELLLEAKQELEDRVQRRTADLAAVVARLRHEIERRKDTTEEIRNVAAHSRCILWRAELSSSAVSEPGILGRCPSWIVHVQDENAAQEVLPLEVDRDSSYYRAWTRSRHPQDALAVSRRCLDAVLGGQKGYSHEYRCLDKHGELRWLSENVRIQALGPGRWRLFGVTTDVTEGRRAAEALRASEERFSLFMEHLPGLAFIKDDAGRYIFMNRACEEWLGVQTPHWLLKRGDELHDTMVADQFSASEALVSASGRALQSMEVLPGKDGSKRFFVFNWFPIRFREGGVTLTGAVAIDITDRRQAEQELIAYQEKLRALSANASATEERERRQIAAALHDQIGSTLAAAQIRLQLLEASLHESSREDFAAGAHKTLPEVVGDLEEAITHTRSLTCELSPPLLYEAGLESAVRWLGDQLLHRHGLRVIVEGDGSIELLSQELKIVVYQGVRELLTNVVKHAGASAATVRMMREGDRFITSVSDDGVGLKPTNGKPSNSFGLFNLRERMVYLGGHISFESSPGEGTRATIELLQPQDNTPATVDGERV